MIVLRNGLEEENVGELVDDFGLNATIGTVVDNFSIPNLINYQNLVFGHF